MTPPDVATADMNAFAPTSRFDRILSVEMFEHMRNWEALLQRVSTWLESDGRLFVHHFCHRTHSYPYEDAGESDWMARNFFTGGLMPAEALLQRFDRDLAVEAHWFVPGHHYQQTSEAWLRNLDARRSEALDILTEDLGAGEAQRALGRWRLFFLAVAECFGIAGGRDWGVTHARLRPTGRAA